MDTKTQELKNINTELLFEVFGHDDEIICDMIDIFVSMAKEYHKEIVATYNTKNWFELGLVTHKAKASCRTMGLKDLGNCLDNIENNAKGIAYNELDETRNLSHDNEKLYKAMLREGQQEGDPAIIDKEMQFFNEHYLDALEEVKWFKENIQDYI